MGDVEWKNEAIKEQFIVRNSLRHLQQDELDTTNAKNVVEAVKKVLTVHLLPKPQTGNEVVRNISLEIIRQHEGNVKFGFIVFVTDQKVNGQLQRIPIFTIQYGNKKVFIDAKCFSYMSWSAVMENAKQIVPNSKFSYPVDGQYTDDNRLQVRFASNMRLYKQVLNFFTWALLGIKDVAANVLFTTVRTITWLTSPLLNLAKGFISKVDMQFLSNIRELYNLIQGVKKGSKTTWEIVPSAFRILKSFYDTYETEIINMASYIKETFKKVWLYIRGMFSSKPGSVPTRALAIVSRANEDYVEQETNSAEVFENCRNENVFHHNAKDKSNDMQKDLAPVTKSMLCLTKSICNENFQCPNGGKQNVSENDFSDVFLTAQTLINDTFNKTFSSYNIYLKAAVASSEGPFNIDRFNKTLGINGDPKSHFLMESVKSIEQSPMCRYLVYKKSLELKINEPVELISVMHEASENKQLGLFRFIARGQSLISAKSFVKELSKRFNVEENNFVEKEEIKDKSAETFLHFGRYLAIIYQNVTDGNDVKGIALIQEIRH